MSHENLNRSYELSLNDYEGVYLGFSPTIHSSIGVGEISVIIDDKIVTILRATGLEADGFGIAQETISRSDVGIIEPENMEVQEVHHFRVGDYIFAFNTSPTKDDEPVLFIAKVLQDGSSHSMDATVLYNQSQIEKGVTHKVRKIIEFQKGNPGGMASLSTGGARRYE